MTIKWVEEIKHVVRDGQIEHEIDGFWLVENEQFFSGRNAGLRLDENGDLWRGKKKIAK